MALHHDVVVIGASAGGFDALARLLPDLPADLAATILAVVHIPSGTVSQLADLLDNRSRLPVRWATDGEPIRAGRVYIAPADRHLLLEDGRMLLCGGPRENRARPAIDPLFRSAAVACGSRVIGVILTGYLSDGAAGLKAIKTCGGLTVVQDPDSAFAPDMPRNALSRVQVDQVVPLADMAGMLESLIEKPAGPAWPVPEALRLENRVLLRPRDRMDTMDRLGKRSPLTCPECQGVLWEIQDDEVLRYRCHEGHAYAAVDLADAQSGSVTQALWSALRAHEERTELLRRMLRDAKARGDRSYVALGWEERVREYEEQSAVLRRFLFAEQSPVVDPAA